MGHSSINKFIVITSIFDPTEAVVAFSKLPDYEVVVVADRKTPINWVCENVKYLSVEKQSQVGMYLNKVLPFNHYSRKMMGYLYAINNGATIIVDTDDDNIPKENWGFPSFKGEYDVIPGNKGFINIYNYFSDQHIWPRGLPLRLINKRHEFESETIEEEINVGVWQGLADEDPDVDAIYRLTSDKSCNFKSVKPVVLGPKSITPFNTQNTIIRKELFPLMYLPSHVTFRFTDILRGLIAQPIMWAYGYHLGYTTATVIQRRNPHDYYKDFISEIPMYQYGEDVVKIVESVISKNESIIDNLHNSYVALKDEGIVPEKELLVLNAWLKDLEVISSI